VTKERRRDQALWQTERLCRACHEGYSPRSPSVFSAENRIGLLLEGLRGDGSLSELHQKGRHCAEPLLNWPKEFMEVSKQRLIGNTARQAISAKCFDDE
jgi:hypothetical protein